MVRLENRLSFLWSARDKKIKMEIRNSTEQDFKRIMEIYVIAREYMKSHGNPNQWGPTKWPPVIHMVLFTV